MSCGKNENRQRRLEKTNRPARFTALAEESNTPFYFGARRRRDSEKNVPSIYAANKDGGKDANLERMTTMAGTPTTDQHPQKPAPRPTKLHLTSCLKPLTTLRDPRVLEDGSKPWRNKSLSSHEHRKVDWMKERTAIDGTSVITIPRYGVKLDGRPKA